MTSGAIELAIISDKYKTEIISIDVQTGRADRMRYESRNSGIQADFALQASGKSITTRTTYYSYVSNEPESSSIPC